MCRGRRSRTKVIDKHCADSWFLVLVCWLSQNKIMLLGTAWNISYLTWIFWCFSWGEGWKLEFKVSFGNDKSGCFRFWKCQNETFHLFHFTGRKKTRLGWCGKAVLNGPRKESCSCSPCPTEGRGRRLLCPISRRSPTQWHSQERGWTRRTNPSLLACAQSLRSNKDDSLVTAAAA